MFKNALVFRIAQWNRPSAAEIEERLSGARFTECGATQKESAGWVEPRGEKHGALVENVGGHMILKLCTETKAVPGSVVKNRLEAELDKVEAQTGRRPKGKRTKEIKEEIVHDLLPRAFPKRGSTLVWIAPKEGFVVVDAASMKKADGVVGLLMELLGDGLALQSLQTRVSPSVAMSEWLKSKESPAGFTIDRECELKQPDSEKSAVRYSRHTLDIDEIGLHIEQGKLPTQLAMTWDGRVSFVLSESLAIKKVRLLDVVLEGIEKAGKGDNGFDADAAIVTGELGRLIPELIDALGGELDRDAPQTRAEGAAPDAAPWEEAVTA